LCERCPRAKRQLLILDATTAEATVREWVASERHRGNPHKTPPSTQVLVYFPLPHPITQQLLYIYVRNSSKMLQKVY